MNNKGRIALALVGMAETMNETMDENRLKGYLAILGELSPDNLRLALLRIGRTQRWYPKPAEILEAIREVEKGQKQERLRKKGLMETKKPLNTDEARKIALEGFAAFKKRMAQTNPQWRF